MDDSLHQLENELKALRPRRPSVLLRARLERELENDEVASKHVPSPIIHTAVTTSRPPGYTTAATLRSWKWLGWQMMAAAAVALLVSLGVWQWQARSDDSPSTGMSVAGNSAQPAPSAPPTSTLVARDTAAVVDAFRPVKAANVLYDLRDEGLVLLEDNTPARRVRARYVDTYTWKNPATNASLRWSVPRDEVRVLPASFH